MLKKRSRPDTSHLQNIVIALHLSRPEIFNRDGFSNDFQFYENMRKEIYRFDDNQSCFTISQQDLEIVIRKAQVLQLEKQLGNQDISETRYLVNIPVGDNQVFDFGLEDQNGLRSNHDNQSDRIVPQQSSTHQLMQVQKAEIKRQHKQEKSLVVTKQAEKQNLQENQVKQSNNDGLAQREQNDPQIAQPDQAQIPAIHLPNNNELAQTEEVKPQIVQPDQGQHSPNNNQNLNNPTQRQMNNQITHDVPQQSANETDPTNELPPTNEVALNVPNQNETEENTQLAQNNVQDPHIQELNQNVQSAEQYCMPVIQQLSWEQQTLINSINKELISYKCSRKEKQPQIDKNTKKMMSFFNVVKPKQINTQQRLKQLEQTMIPIGNILCKLKIDNEKRLRLVKFCLKGHKNNDVVIQKFQTYKKLNQLTGLQLKDRQFKYGYLYDRYVFF